MSRAQRTGRWLLRSARTAATLLAAAVLAGWLAGQIVSDRFAWSQWLLWIPTPAAFAAAAVGLAAAAARPAGPGRRRRLLGWGACAAAVGLYFATVDHRFLPRGAPEPGLRLVHCTVPATGPRRLAGRAEVLRALDADVLVATSPLPAQSVEALRERLGDAARAVTSWPFLLVSRAPILTARPLIANRDARVALFQVATDAGPLTIYAVDLPSDPRIPRRRLALETRATLDQLAGAPPPDVVVGDFNLTRGSAALRALFPGLEHAYDQGGHGYAATFPRAFPLYHIDHTLLGAGVRATDYALVDLGFGRHLAQVAELTPARR